MSLDGFSLTPLVAELHEKIAGGRIDKIFQPDRFTLSVWIRKPGENLCLVISANPAHPRIHLTSAPPENPATPPAFCMLLRKHLEDGRIAEIRQHSQDRIVHLNIDVRDEYGVITTKCLIIELMGKHSNIILTHEEIIIDAIKRIDSTMSRHRQVLPTMEYLFPPGQARLNLLAVPARQCIQTLIETQKSNTLAKAIINTGMGIGPLTANEIAARANLQPETPVNSLDDNNIIALCDSIDTIVKPVANGAITPTVITDSENRFMAIAAFELKHLSEYNIHKFITMSLAVEFTVSIKKIQVFPEREPLQKLLATELARLIRKKAILTEELAEANAADHLRKQADIIMTNLHAIPKGIQEITLSDIFSENQDQDTQITVSLDPSLTALENAKNYYAKYNKLKRAQEMVDTQLTQCSEDIAYIESIITALEHASASAEINEISQELVAAGYIKQSSAKKRRRMPSPPSSPLTVTTPDGNTIMVGKNNRQNDLVTKQAHPDDIWLHTKDIPGSHVILKTGTREPSAADLMTAAQLAAYFSKARQSSNVPVDYTKRRYVRKPAGSKPGFVIYDHQNTLYVTPDEVTLNKLMQTK